MNMKRVLYQHKGEQVHTEVTAIIEYGKFTLSGYDKYQPSKQLPEGSEYEYETILDSVSTQQLMDLIAPNQTEALFLDAFYDKFAGERAIILFQAFCLEHDIETYCSSYFDD